MAATIEVRTEPFDPLEILARHRPSLQHQAGKYGATAVFIGTLRDFNEGDSVQAMTLEHYPGMTERELHRLVETAGQTWPLLDTLIVHRVGELLPNDPIVLVAVWSAHRAAAFGRCA